MGDDVSFNEGFAQTGASKEMPGSGAVVSNHYLKNMVLGFAVVTVAISASSGASLILRNIAASATVVIGVMNLFVHWFLSFVN